jgi:septum formation protein
MGDGKGGGHMLILASASPRRIKLLKDAGLEFKVVPSNIDETVERGWTPEETVRRLASQKAMAVAMDHPNDTVIGADTIVVLGNEILGKPSDKEDAARMLKNLSGRTHVVHTGVAIVRDGTADVFNTRADVTMRVLTELEIRKYVESGEPMDKAGAYAIQGEGASLVGGYVGDFFTIVGLPLKTLLKHLDMIGS